MRRPYAVLFSERAKCQIADAQAWLLGNRGVERFQQLEDELGSALRLLEAFPQMYPLAPGSKAVRRLRLEKSGYHVYYRVFPREELIYVTRIRHQRRRPLPP
jgi:plasmid stabilization system protein ParE